MMQLKTDNLQDVKKKVYVPITQDDCGYMVLSPQAGKACANCRFFQFDNSGWSACALIMNWPQPIMNTGYCDRWEGEPEPLMQEPVPVMIVEADKQLEIPAQSAESGDSAVLPERRGIWQTVMDWLRPALPIEQKAINGAQFKALGDGYWAAWYSNNYEDREAEIIAGEAHDRYIQRVKAGIVPLPELWYWHIPGSVHGKALWVDRIDHMMLAIGKFDETPIGKTMQKHYEESGRTYAMSHGFTSDKNKHFRNGVWYDINTFELSPLDPDVAANVITLFSGVKSMTVSQKALDDLKGILIHDMGETEGLKTFEGLMSVTKSMNESAEELGKRYKDFSDPAKADQPIPGTQPPPPEQVKSLAPLVLELTQSQADTVSIQAKQSAQIDALANGIKGINAALEGIQSTLALTPRRASQDDGTVLSQEAAKQIKQNSGEFDTFWADLQVSK